MEPFSPNNILLQSYWASASVSITENLVETMITKIVSGGQTGVDRAGLDVALALQIPCGGWCPKGRLAEDGVIPDDYPLNETPSERYDQRTEWNVRDSEGTLVINMGRLSSGTLHTVQIAKALKKPFLVVQVDQKMDCGAITKWFEGHDIQILNIAGPRQSKYPDIYLKTKNLLMGLLR
jgi:hypothetical protein